VLDARASAHWEANTVDFGAGIEHEVLGTDPDRMNPSSYSSLILATFSRNHAGDPDQTTRSASTVAGIRGFSLSSARIAGSTALIPDSGAHALKSADHQR
jgi:hypothetical protein